MPLLSVGVCHREATPEQLAALGHAENDLCDHLAHHTEGLIDGFVVLSTCNRFEIYLDAITFHGALGMVMEAIATVVPEASNGLADAVYTHVSAGAITHLYRVAAGLESMVVGENEIIGQVRSCLAGGRMVSPRLRRAFQGALTTAKAITTNTSLGRVRRSLASVGMDLAASEHSLENPEETLLPPWSETRVLILGTGQYAGTVVADLTRRGCTDMIVYSASGNALAFAETHPVVPTADLSAALKSTDLLVTASGNGIARIDPELLEGAQIQVIVDLSGGVDLAEDLPVRVIGLTEIGCHAPPACQESVDQAEQMVSDAVAELMNAELGRGAAPAITAMRGHITGIIEAEVARARNTYTPEVADAIEKALHRVTGAMLHHPSVAATELARIGRMEEYNQALQTLFGIMVEA
ncbi:MAG: glutamyl-tRNA reductase [Propionibacteriaceae bacterium]|jgi:glutamyl-tRNA reductase|nr:glutamyl-tRNA reductase [Propionibacteriaceae bacterium]